MGRRCPLSPPFTGYHRLLLLFQVPVFAGRADWLYLCAPKGHRRRRTVRRRGRRRRSIGHVCAPSLFQKVIARCTQIPPDLESYDKNRRTLYEGLVAAGYQVAKPQGAFYLFVKAPEGDSEAFSQRAKEKDLLIVPGKDFGCPGYCRLCYCVPYEKIQKSIPIFRELIGKTH